jgi:hypothetical protein
VASLSHLADSEDLEARSDLNRSMSTYLLLTSVILITLHMLSSTPQSQTRHFHSASC